MCGRFSLNSPPEEIRHAFGYEDNPNFPPRYNVAPTQPVGIVRVEEGVRRFRLVRWGLIPSWVKDPKSFTLLINARSETAHEKPAFKAAIQRRRCLVPANGFYEWQRRAGPGKQPFWVRPVKGGLIGFAGVWERWMGRDGEELETMAILTAAAPPSLEDIHHRVPVVISPGNYARWLDTNDAYAGTLNELLRPPPDDFFAAIPIGMRVNVVANDDPGLQDAVDPEAEREDDDSARLAKLNAGHTAAQEKDASRVRHMGEKRKNNPSREKQTEREKAEAAGQLDLF